MADDEELASPPGEFPPGLEALNAEVEQLATSQHRGEDIRGQAEHIMRQAAPFVEEARRALAQIQGDIDALPGRIREALAEMNSQAEALLSGARSMTIGGTEYPAIAAGGSFGLPGLSFSGVGFVEAAGAVDLLEVQKSGRMLGRLSPAKVFWITLIWLPVAGVSVVMEQFNLPPDVVQQLQTDPNYVGLALTLTIMILASPNRRK
jgi:hypothetical protein